MHANNTGPNGTFPDPNERAPTILVVDDEPLIRALVSDHLQECGYKVLEGASADEAISILEQNNLIIDLVFTDVNMPGSMDGFGLAHWLKANRPDLPYLLASGDTKKATLAKDLCEHGPFITKPYDLALVVVGIRASINKARTRSGW